MQDRQPIPGKDFWPDQHDWPSDPPPETPSLLWQAFLFLLVFAALQGLWLQVRDDVIGHFIRGDLTVKPAVSLINIISPHVGAIANGNQIKAPGGGIVIKLGCEGVEALFILIAAFISAHIPRHVKVEGILVGCVFIYIFNQVRILALFYAFRMDRPLFYFLHSTVAPVLLIALSGLFFHFWLRKFGSFQTVNP